MRIIIIAVLLTVTVPAHSQDLVVTPEGDSINCRITEIKNGNISLTFSHGGETHSTVVPIQEVKAYKYGFYVQVIEPMAKPAANAFHRWRFSFDAAYSYRLGAVPDGYSASARNYMDELKSGYSLKAMGAYFFSENAGIGIQFNQYNSSNSQSNMQTILPDGTTFTGSVSDDIAIWYVGPTFVTHMSPSKYGVWTADVSLGYLAYKDLATLGPDFIRIEGRTFGLALGIGYDIFISQRIGLGFGISMMFGSLTKLELSNGTSTTVVTLPDESAESLSRFDLVAGLRIYK